MVMKEEINSLANIPTFTCSPFQIEGVLLSVPHFSLSQKSISIQLFLQITVEILLFLQVTNEEPNKTG